MLTLLTAVAYRDKFRANAGRVITKFVVGR